MWRWANTWDQRSSTTTAARGSADSSPKAKRRRPLATLEIRSGVPYVSGLWLTPVALRMLVVGERASKMGEMMENIASFHDEEIARWVDWFIRLFEPLLMAFIGIVIGVIVVLMYLPIFELAASVH